MPANIITQNNRFIISAAGIPAWLVIRVSVKDREIVVSLFEEINSISSIVTIENLTLKK